jgi:hypothetical protein
VRLDDKKERKKEEGVVVVVGWQGKFYKRWDLKKNCKKIH